MEGVAGAPLDCVINEDSDTPRLQEGILDTVSEPIVYKQPCGRRAVEGSRR